MKDEPVDAESGMIFSNPPQRRGEQTATHSGKVIDGVYLCVGRDHKKKKSPTVPLECGRVLSKEREDVCVACLI
jgi:hypothetical protein